MASTDNGESKRVNPITQEDFDKIKGKVFVHNGSYSVTFMQVFRHTKSFVFARCVPGKRTRELPSGDGTHQVDWEWVKNTPLPERGPRGGTRYSLEKSGESYYLTKGRGSASEIFWEAKEGSTYLTVEY